MPIGSGSGTLTYTLTGPNGADLSEVPELTFDEDTRVLSGTPTTAADAIELTYTAMADLGNAIANFDIEVVERAVFYTPPTNQTYPAGVEITDLTLPEADGGTSTLAYTLTGPNGADLSEVPGLTFDEASRVLSGTPTIPGETTLTYTVTGGTTTTFTVTVTGATFASVQADLTVATGATTTLTLPEAAGGTGALTYTLTGPNDTDLSEVPGLAFDEPTRVLSITPTAAGSIPLTYTVTDSATVPAIVTQIFRFTVTSTVFAETVPDLTLTANAPPKIITLPEATGSGTLYTLTGPNGMDLSELSGSTFDADTRELSARGAVGAVVLIYTATDSAGTALGSLVFTVTVVAAPAFVGTFTDNEFDDQTYNQGRDITVLTLPVASGGHGKFRYQLNTIPKGLIFDPVTRTLSGSPAYTNSIYRLRYNAIDENDGSSVLTFGVTVVSKPYFEVVVADQTYSANTAITNLTLPEASGGVTLSYTLTGPGGDADAPALPDGLTFAAATRVLSGMPTTAADATELTYTVTSTFTDGTETVTETVTETAMRTFMVTVSEGPVFVSTQGDQGYIVSTAITALTLPEATGGSGTLTYALTGPNGTDLSEVPGLAFDVDTRVLSGTPTTPATTELTYTATDSAEPPNVDTQTFTVTVRAAGANNPPTVVSSARIEIIAMPNQVLDKIDLTPYFTDADGDSLTYTAEADNLQVGVDVTGATMTLIMGPVPHDADDRTIVTATARDIFGATSTDDEGIEIGVEFAITIAAPIYQATPMPDVTLSEGIARRYRDVNGGDQLFDYFPQPTEHVLRFEASSSNPDIVHVELSNQGISNTPPVVTLTPGEIGSATITISSFDRRGMPTSPASDTFQVTVTAVGPGPPSSGATRINQIILPEIARAMADSTVSAIARRIEQAGSAARTPAVTLGGQSSLASALNTHGKAISKDSSEFKKMLGGSGFVLPLNATEGAANSGLSSVAFWGSGDYRNLSGKSGTVDWDGDLSGFHLGVDARLRKDLLAGVAVSKLQSKVDYNDGRGSAADSLDKGEHEVDVTSVHPYIGWSTGALDLWATAGYGSGEVEITPKDGTKSSSDIDLRTVGAGASGQLLEYGATTLRLKGEALQTTLEVDGSAELTALEVDAYPPADDAGGQPIAHRGGWWCV